MPADASEVHQLAAVLAAAPARVLPALVPVAHKAGVKMKAGMRRAATGHRKMSGLPNYVEYDIVKDARSVGVEVGFRKEGQGNLANFAAFGSANNAPIMDITEPLRAEVPSFTRYVAEAAEKALL